MQTLLGTPECTCRCERCFCFRGARGDDKIHATLSRDANREAVQCLGRAATCSPAAPSPPHLETTEEMMTRGPFRDGTRRAGAGRRDGGGPQRGEI